MRNRSKAALIESPSAQGEQPRPYIDAERLGSLEIDYKVEIRRLHWKISLPGTLENLSGLGD